MGCQPKNDSLVGDYVSVLCHDYDVEDWCVKDYGERLGLRQAVSHRSVPICNGSELQYCATRVSSQDKADYNTQILGLIVDGQIDMSEYYQFSGRIFEHHFVRT